MNVLKGDLKRFILIGICSNIINFVVYTVSFIFSNSLLFGSVLGYIFGLYFSFHYGRTWVFGENFKNSYSNLIRFILVYLFGLILMSTIIEVMTNHFLVDYKISWFIGAFFAFTNNFIGSKWIVFK